MMRSRRSAQLANYMLGQKDEAVWFCRVAYATHVGARPTQEDALFVDGLSVLPSLLREVDSDVPVMTELECSLPCVFALADGMGGQNGGDIASETCIRQIADLCKRLPSDMSLRDAIEDVQSLIHSISMQLCAMAAKDIGLKDMGTTLVMLLVCKDGGAVLGIGDSRAYSFKSGSLRLITKDDTEGQRLLDLGLVTRNELVDIGDKDRLIRYVGMCRPGLIVRASEHIVTLDEQVFLLCSDGLSKALSTHMMETVLSSDRSLLGKAEALVLAAANLDDSDNTSVIIVRIR